MASTLRITRLTGFGRGKTESYSGNTISLGTDSACEVRFDPVWDKTVSPRHAKLTWSGETLLLEDQSRDGCWIQGRRVNREALQPGTTVELGRGGPTLRVDFEPAPVAAQPASAPAQSAPARTQASSQAFPAPVIEPMPGPRSNPISRSWSKPVLVGVACAALILLALVVIWSGRNPATSTNKDADQQLMAAAKEYGDAVGLVVLVLEVNGRSLVLPSGTAWAIGEKVLVSNSHVTRPVRFILQAAQRRAGLPVTDELRPTDDEEQAMNKFGVGVYIVLNGRPEKRYQVTRAVVHPKYGQDLPDLRGRKPAVPAYDVGLLYVDMAVPKWFKPAPDTELKELASGYRVAYLGFPMEGMAGEGVDLQHPVANMQSGILTSTTDYWLAKASLESAHLLQHNLGAAGGASGSPVFNGRGEVVGILSAGNVIALTEIGEENGKLAVIRKRAPSAVMINFAQRIDLLRDIYPEYAR